MNRQSLTDGVRTAGHSVIFWFIFFVIMMPVVVAAAVFVFLYSLAILGPWLSSRFQVKYRLRRVVDRIFGIENILDFREDIRDLVYKHSKVDISGRTANEIRQNILSIHQNASNQAERGEFLVAIVVGISSLILSIVTGISIIGWLLGLYSVVMSLTIGLHVVVLDILAYNDDDELSPYRREELAMMEGWNRALLSNWTMQAYVLIIGVLYRVSDRGYQIAKELIDTILEKGYSRSESVLYISSVLARTANNIISSRAQ